MLGADMLGDELAQAGLIYCVGRLMLVAGHRDDRGHAQPHACSVVELVQKAYFLI